MYVTHACSGFAVALALLFSTDAPAVVATGKDPHAIPAVTGQLSDAKTPAVTSRLLDLFSGRQFAELDKLLNAYQAEYEKDTYKEQAAKVAFDTFFLPDPDLEPLFDEWRRQFPGSYAANLASGIYDYAMGITWRGDKYASRTHPHRFDEMRIFMEQAEQHIQASLPQTKKPIMSLALLIRIAKLDGSPQEATGFLDRAIAADPYCMSPRIAYMYHLEPRWGGSFEAMRRYAEETKSAGNHPKIVQVAQILGGWVHGYQGDSYFRNAEYNKALAEYEQAIASSEWDNFLVSRGWLYQKVGQTDLAIRDLSRALDQNPHDDYAHYVRGLALLDKYMTSEALTDLQSAARHGNTYAMNRLGQLYGDGEHGVPVRVDEALRWWGKAAYFWDENALFALGKTYERGIGVPVDQAAAVKYYRIAADEGYGPAQNDLGLMLWYGRGAPADQEEAVRLWRLAAKRGVWQARHNLNFFLGPVERAKIAVTDPQVFFDSKTLRFVVPVAGALLAIVAFVLRSRRTGPAIEEASAASRAEPGSSMHTDRIQGLSGKTYRVATTRYKIFGWIILSLTLGGSILAWRNGETGIVPMFLPFVALGIYLLLTAPDIVLDQEKILLRSVIGSHRIRWGEVRWAERGSSGTLVLQGTDKRLVIPPPTKWSGPDKSSMLAAIYAELSRRGLRIVPKLTADFKTNKNVAA